MSNHDLHHDWLALIEISGPFLAVPVLKEVFPQGLEELDGVKRKRLRQAYEEWRDALESEDLQFNELHTAWIDEVLSRGLDLDEDGKGDVLKRTDWCAANLNVTLPEHGVTLAADLAVIDERRANKPLLLIQTYRQDVDLDSTLKLDEWAATPADRMVQLCRATGCRLGLVTNGERWMLVDAPLGAVTSVASWYARIWSQEPITLQAFVHLLGIRRFFVDEAEQLPALFDRSLKYQDEVTDALGEQVQRAVEVLIQALDKADQDRDRELLRDVKEPVLYEAALTVMMRLVFLLSAEERGLLLLGDECYEANYALSTLRMQLRKESEEILERRWDAWSRLLAVFRAVYGGIEHENLRLPALGGSLFDPDRFAFLEGRVKGSGWRTDIAKPLPIDNRTVLLLLEAIQQFQGRTLSYRALDVEQIGYVYEGLLERTVKRTAEVTLELDGTKNAKAPSVKLAELESARLDGAERLAELMKERSGSSGSRVRNDLSKPVDDLLADRLLAACHGDTGLRDRIKPFAHLVRTDPWGYPLVYPAGAFIVTTGSDRRETGTHYTPKSLTEAIVAETLTPVAYVGPAEGCPREKWVPKSPAELLDLKICDPAMGSGAFLVQACRWLADRLVEAWSQVEATGKTVSMNGEVLDVADAKERLPRDTEARTIIARSLIAERCLYGVDLNPLAVELAKLSIWLVTLAKGRPFGFLDHNLRCGDSLLGIHRLEQLTELSMAPNSKGQQRLFGQNVERAVHEAIELRHRLRKMPIRDIRDVEVMARLDADARRKLEVPERIADAFIGELFGAGTDNSLIDARLAALAIQAGRAIGGDLSAVEDVATLAMSTLSLDVIGGQGARHPFHWPLEFPEVFDRGRSGFDSFVGNPPFLGAMRIAPAFGDFYQRYLKARWSHRRGAADLSAYFFLRAYELVSAGGTLGLISTNTISQGNTKLVGLEYISGCGGVIYSAVKSMKWPGSANVFISIVHIYKGEWRGKYRLDDRSARKITSALDDVAVTVEPHKLTQMPCYASRGSTILGIGFVVSIEEADTLRRLDHKNAEILFPYLNAIDFSSSASLSASRAVINFGDLPLEAAQSYEAPFKIVFDKVRPQREKPQRQVHEEDYWKFSDKRPDLYESLRSLNEALVCGMATKYFAFAFVPADQVFADKIGVFATEDRAVLSVLTSTIHQTWALQFMYTLKGDPCYSLSTCFRTFPFCTLSEYLREIGRKYHDCRSSTMLSREEGLTKIYNRFHDPKEMSDDIVRLRKFQYEIDSAVASSYGWNDLALEQEFDMTQQGLRFTLRRDTRLEILTRLAALNAQYNEDSRAGEDRKRATKGRKRRKDVGAGTQELVRQSALFPKLG